ncbi:MAG: Calx-beta domain-containing protein [Planctomycetaceae bacterium]
MRNRRSNRKRQSINRAQLVEQLEDRTLLAVTTLQNAKDNHLTNFQDQRANLGGMNQLQFYKADDSVYRPMLDFNTASIPTGSTIGDAQLQLWHEGGLYANSDMNVTLYALSSNWTEGTGFNHSTPGSGSSWIQRTDTSDWNTPGGDFVTNQNFGNGNNGIVAQATIPAYTTDQWVSFEVTNLVDAWVNDGLANHGVAFVITSGNYTEHVFASGETAKTSRRPRLVVDTESAPTPGRIGFSQSNVTVDEATGSLQLTVQRTNGDDGSVSVQYATSNGSATAPGDYSSRSGTLTFADGQTSRTISIPINNDTNVENTETFEVTLSNPTGGASLGTNQTTISITDNDATTGEIVLQNAKDNHFTNFQNQRANLGGMDRLQFFKVGNDSYRPIIQFDLDSVPSGTNAIDASLELYRDAGLYANAPMGITIYALSRSWTEGSSFNHGAATSGSNWLNRTNTSAWNTPGGDFNTTYNFGNGNNGIVAQTTIAPFSSADWVPFDVTPAVQAWLDGDIPNHGLAFVITSGDHTEYSFVSSEGSTASQHPKLVLTTSGASLPGSFSFSPSTVTVNEAAGTVSVNVARTGGVDGTVSVQYATSNVTATAGSDYSSRSGTLSFADGQSSRSISIPIVNNSVEETLETFRVTLSNPTGGASIGTGEATVTIVDDDEPVIPGTLSITPTSLSVNESIGSVTLTIARTGGSDGAVSVQYATQNVSANAGQDYTSRSGTISFADGESSKTVTVPIINDTSDEPNETFRVNLSSPGGGASLGASTSTITIVDNDEPAEPGNVALATSIYNVDEDAGTVTVQVERTGGTDGVVSIDYQTFAGTAAAGSDFTGRSGTLTFQDGVSAATVSIPVLNDNTVEGDESFSITIDNPAGGATLLAPRTATITILDDETGITPLFDYDNFNDVSDLNLNGSAARNGSRLLLTQAVNSQAGSAFLQQPLEIKPNTSFETEFSFSLTGGTSGADGITFTLQNDAAGSNALGANAGNVGYAGISQSIAFEFDTWQNPWDPSNNHTDLLRDGNIEDALATRVAPFDLNSGSTYYAWVQYDGDSDLLELYVDDDPVIPANPRISTTIDLAEVLGSQAFLGFTGGTGGANNVQEIRSWEFASNSRLLPTPPETGSVSDEALFSGLSQPIALDWSPDGQNLFIAEKGGVIKVVRNGNLQSTPFIDISGQVNNNSDRGLIDIAVHPDFAANPYVYLLYTYDPPETNNFTESETAQPDGIGNRAGRLMRVTANAATNYTTIVPGSETVILGQNSTWANFNGFVNSTTDFDEPPAGILANGSNLQDFVASDSLSHTVGAIEFGPDGALYVSIGDGTSYNRVDPRTTRVQDIDNLSGKVLRINPINGRGYSNNPFYNGNTAANRSKVYQLGVRNSFRMTIDQASGRVYTGDVGWTQWEEINTGPAGANFGWPYYEGGEGTSLQTGGYQNLPEAQAFYASGSPVTAPLVGLNHQQTGINAIVLGDFYTGDAYPEQYQGNLFFNDLGQGIVRTASLDAAGNLTNVEVFTTGARYYVQMKQAPDGTMFYADLVNGVVGRWVFDTGAAAAAATPTDAEGVEVEQQPIAGAGVTIAVIDSGVQLDHPELQSAIWTNESEVAGDGIDNDGNGYIDDINGYDFLDADADPYDTNGHGTFVAGVIAAAHDATGTSGIAPYARIMPLRVLDGSASGATDDVANAIRYAVDNGADIINLSMTTADSTAIRDAVEYADANGVLVVAASGNDGGTTPAVPASLSAHLPTVISAGAYDANGLFDGSSLVGNSGAVQIDAPAVMLSTIIGSNFGTYAGTSVSAASISAVAALVKSANADFTAAQVRDVLVASAAALADGSDSAGTLDATAAVELALSLGDVSIVGGSGSAVVGGTPGDDTIEYELFSKNAVRINGVSFAVPGGFDELEIDGAGGTNVVIVTGTHEDESAVLRPSSATIDSRVAIDIANAESITVLGGDGTDSVEFYDTDGAEQFVGGPQEATLTGSNFVSTANGFEDVRVFGQKGELDKAILLDSPGDDSFASRVSYSIFTYPTGQIRVDRMKDIQAFASQGGNDTATLKDSSRNDRVHATPNSLRLKTSSFQAVASGFDTATATGSKGKDYAYFYDSTDDDVF